MLVQKIFSDVERGDRLFSVIMDEDEYALFSEILEQRDYSKFSQAIKKAATKIGKTPEAQKIKAELVGAGTKAQLGYARGTRNIMDSVADAYQTHTLPITSATGRLVEKGAKGFKGILNKSGKEITTTMGEVRKRLNKLSDEELRRMLFKG